MSSNGVFPSAPCTLSSAEKHLPVCSVCISRMFLRSHCGRNDFASACRQCGPLISTSTPSRAARKGDCRGHFRPLCIPFVPVCSFASHYMLCSAWTRSVICSILPQAHPRSASASYKLILPMIASMPLLMVYAINCNATAVKLPGIVANLYGETFLDLGFLFYLYMAMLAVFCTNTVNILAGVNGVEAAQSLVIALCLFINSFVQYLRLDDLASQEHHELSMCLLLPFISVTSALLYYNWYPSSVFVGDTFCYFAGMLFAVCGILAHFSKTVLLFLIPQIINFVLSLPQLFRIVPCPRHRLPKFNADTRQLNMSYATVPKAELGGLGLLVLKVYKLFRLSHVEESATEFRYSNMTILNLLLFWLGPTPEDRLVVRFLVLQTVTCVFAFYLRYGFAAVLYDIVQ
eukprot:m.32951 g.32951  ORF g.32951 m.32951 type:complete len:403 (+) comp5589_c0_seq2:1283-2491(+)